LFQEEYAKALEEYTKALAELRAALQLRPDLWKIRALLGMAEKRTGDIAKARADLEQAFSGAVGEAAIETG
jgi:Flp pilus assembly protein TadD